MPTLRPPQNTAANVVAQQSTLLLADVGAGKTATAAQAILNRSVIYGRKHVLVLGTKRICDMVWGDELAIWAPRLKYASVAGLPAVDRCTVLEDRSLDVVGLNYENLIWAVKEYGYHLPALFPWLIIDECSKLENPASKSFRAIRPYLDDFEWRLPMTGTPRANHLSDIWGNAYLADLGEALGFYQTAFLQRWFFPVRRVSGMDWIPKFDAEKEIYGCLKHAVHRMPFEHPKPVEIDMLLPLNSEVKNIQQLIDDQLKRHSEAVIDGITFARNGQRQHGKMLQLSSGFAYDDDRDVVHYHDDKILALEEIVREAKGEPMMVVFQFDHERDAIFKRFPQARLLDSDASLADWNAGKIEMLLVHPRSCGHGLNAQFSGSDLQVWFTPTTDAELYTQTVGRMNRPGNPKTVRVIRLIMKGTKDKAAYMVVAARQRGESATLDQFE